MIFNGKEIEEGQKVRVTKSSFSGEVGDVFKAEHIDSDGWLIGSDKDGVPFAMCPVIEDIEVVKRGLKVGDVVIAINNLYETDAGTRGVVFGFERSCGKYRKVDKVRACGVLVLMENGKWIYAYEGDFRRIKLSDILVGAGRMEEE